MRRRIRNAFKSYDLPSHMPLLNEGDDFPPLTLMRVDGTRLTLPVAGAFQVVLFNRGHWCPSCKTQLLGFQRALDRLEATGVRVFALSADSRESALRMVDTLHLTFPVGYGLDVADAHTRFGVFAGRLPGGEAFVQGSGFVLGPRGTVLAALYSAGATGRLSPDEVLALVGHLRTTT